jgi:acyl CoA:acetate/3-ketoacid CoA transferase beta subunit
MTAASRLSCIDDVLGTLVCGARNACVGVVGAAQIDRNGDINTSLVNDELQVGSGGASDVAASAREVVVLTRSDRMVEKVDYVTSPGTRVRCVVTDQCVFEREGPHAAWTVVDVYEDCQAGVASLRDRCPWSCRWSLLRRPAISPSPDERAFLQEHVA